MIFYKGVSLRNVLLHESVCGLTVQYVCVYGTELCNSTSVCALLLHRAVRTCNSAVHGLLRLCICVSYPRGCGDGRTNTVSAVCTYWLSKMAVLPSYDLSLCQLTQLSPSTVFKNIAAALGWLVVGEGLHSLVKGAHVVVKGAER